MRAFVRMCVLPGYAYAAGLLLAGLNSCIDGPEGLVVLVMSTVECCMLTVPCRWFPEEAVQPVPEAKHLDIILYSREQVLCMIEAAVEAVPIVVAFQQPLLMHWWYQHLADPAGPSSRFRLGG